MELSIAQPDDWYIHPRDGVTDLLGNVYLCLEKLVLIDAILKPLLKLKVVFKLATAMDAVKFVESCNEGTY
ncbi:hypothetical protein L1987_37438 [Smallanthus sonchifolius]|uniref:Uncharacterized protein n=1 Tax=Smallanthus sonchifolius TaxID=185202 RepID=A0ACB9HFX7_9ASTR|nr:hypothetical protein L1987_37438 [Smallanthus sonchifolius]